MKPEIHLLGNLDFVVLKCDNCNVAKNRTQYKPYCPKNHRLEKKDSSYTFLRGTHGFEDTDFRGSLSNDGNQVICYPETCNSIDQ
jgi:hypothetical protein